VNEGKSTSELDERRDRPPVARQSVAWLVVVVLLVGASAVYGATETWAQAATTIDCPICRLDLSQYQGPLGPAEVQGLLQALNVEYQNRAKYAAVIQQFGQVQPFVNVRGAEEVHVAELVALFRTYDEPVPDDPWPGQVPAATSVQAACADAVAGELAQGPFYDDLLATTDRYDIRLVYEQLQRASLQRHLVAFSRCAR
jgi:hypothetical protein